MNLKDLSKKKIFELTTAERDFIKSRYKAYFDALDNPRSRALGYCVVCGGVPTDKVGALDIVIRNDNGRVGVGFNIGPFPILNGINGGGETMRALRAFIVTDQRFTGALSNPTGACELRLPLFISTKNSKHVGGRLHDCKSMMAAAGREIGFNGSKIKLYQLGDDLRICVGGFKWDSAGGIFWGDSLPVRNFPFSVLGDWRNAPAQITYPDSWCNPITNAEAKLS